MADLICEKCYTSSGVGVSGYDFLLVKESRVAT